MICSNCQSELSEITLFCPFCGALLTSFLEETPTPTELSKGDIFGNRYEIIKIVGKGGMGIVYRAVDRVRREIVALKTISKVALQKPGVNAEIYRARFIQEAKAISRVKHPNIVEVFDIGEVDGETYIAMEYLEGITLEDHLELYGPVEFARAKIYAIQIAKALHHIHRQNIIHRDMKPLNIMILSNDKDKVKVMDFGLVKIMDLDNRARFTKTGQIVGTPHYLSPELINGKNIDHRSDVFSFGVLYYEMLTGVNPFDSSNVAIVLQKILDIVPPAPSFINPDVPSTADGIVMNCLQKNLKLRYQSMNEVIEDLESEDEDFDTGELAIQPGDTSKIRFDPVLKAKILEFEKKEKELIDTRERIKKETKTRQQLHEAENARYQEDWRTALQIYTQILNRKNSVEAAWTGKCLCLLYLGEKKTLATFLQRAMAIFQTSVDLKAVKVLYELRFGTREKAVQLMKAIDHIQYKSEIPWLVLGEIKLPESRSEAEMAFQSAIEASGDRWHIYYQIGKIYYHYGMFSSSHSYFHQAHSHSPDNARVFLQLGVTANSLGNLDDAVRYLIKARNLDPQFEEAIDLLKEIKSNEQSAGFLQKAQRLFRWERKKDKQS